MNLSKRPLGAMYVPMILVLLAGALYACGSESPAERPRCAQCGMYADAAPQWRGDAETASGELRAFDSPKCLLRYRLAHPDELRRARLRDYYDQGEHPIEELFYVRGSDLRSPMGADLVPLATEEAARAFAADHGGAVLAWDAVDAAVLASLDP